MNESGKFMSKYPFEVFKDGQAHLQDKSQLRERPLASIFQDFAKNAAWFVPDPALETSLNISIALGAPLLLSGEPGSGKTQIAYYVARQLNLEPVLHFQAKSDSRARDLLYEFDAVRYFHDARFRGEERGLNKAAYLEPRPLWQAMASREPRVLLIDDIDQAPRDFANDLLHELDKMEFSIPELGKTYSGQPKNRPLVFITTNSERRLPDAFLRRCVFHYLQMDNELFMRVALARQEEFAPLSPGFIRLAVERFLALRDRELRKRPATGELLAWLKVLALAASSERLDTDPAKLPYLGVLLKDHEDRRQMIEDGGRRSDDR